MNRRQKIIISVTGIFLVTLILVGLTYAYFLTRINGNPNDASINVTTALLDLTFTDGSENVTVNNIMPITTDDVLTNGKVKTFTIAKKENTSNAYVKLVLTDLNVSENLAEYDFKWALYQGDRKVSTGDFGGKTSGEIVLATNEFIDSTTGKIYDLYIWVNESGIDQSDMMNGSLTARIDGTGTGTPLKTLASAILGENNANVITTAPTFTESSTDKGLFVQQEDTEKSEMGFPTYYYRGSVTNNYVKFGTYASSGSYTYSNENWEEATFTYTAGEPIIWRVVRTNEDGSIRLISENVVSDGVAFNSTGYSKYINDDGTDSKVKTAVETWYNTNIGSNSSLDNKVVTSSFCNDISGIDFEGVVGGNNFENVVAGNSYTRLESETPSPIYTCPGGSIKAYEKVGMITADELVYSGALYYKSVTNNTTYLNNNSDYWTLTPYDSNRASSWDPNGASIGCDFVNNGGFAVSRAVINLSPDVIVSSGDGLSPETAYVIE